jgi:hypothetical protein
MRGSFRLVAVALAVFLVGASAALAAGANRLKAGLNYHSLPYCDGSGYLQTGTPGFGTVSYRYRARAHRVVANVTLQNAAPNHTYYVRLTQGESDCYTDDGTLTTDATGTATGTFKEAATSSTAYIWICTRSVADGGCGIDDDYYGSNKIFTHGGSPAARVRSDATPARSS